MGKISLSELQKSYLVGRKLKKNLGGVPCHAYFEFEGEELDINNFKRAWEAVKKDHIMIHSSFLEDGEIKREESIDKSLFVFNLSNLEEKESQEILLDCRENISHRAMDITRGQAIGCEIFLLKDNKTRICFDVDLACTDVYGIQEILNELGSRLANKDLKERSYKLESKESFTQQTLKSKEREEILIKQETKLPYGDNAQSLYNCQYASLDYKFSKEEFEKLKALYKDKLFAQMLKSLWDTSKQENMLVNIPYFLKEKEGYDFVADNTKVFWLKLNKACASTEAIDEIVKKRLLEEEKDYKLEKGLVPLVFSYNQNGIFLNEDFVNNIGKLTYMISQTPNVCLDVQLFNMLDGLLVSFVYPKEISGLENIKIWYEDFISKVKELINNGD